MSKLGDRIKQIRAEAGLTGEQFGKAISISKAYVSQLESGVRANLDAAKIKKICQLYSVNRDWLENGTELDDSAKIVAKVSCQLSGSNSEEKDKKSTAISIGVRLIPVFGMAQALGYKPHHGDVIPDNVYALPKVPVMDDGRQYAAFRVEGRSMEPTLMDGVTVLCDLHQEPTNKCVVCIKWDDTVCVKRWRRVGDKISLTSDNPQSGEDYTIDAKDVDWCLRVRRVLIDLP